jgi:hypothetical protein
VSRTTRLALVAACAAAAALSAGCAAGPSAATLQIHPNLPAASTGSMGVQDVVVVVDPSTSTAQLTGTVVNDGDNPDQLVGVTIGKQAVSFAPVNVAGHSTANLANPKVTDQIVQNATGSQPGKISEVVFTFASGGSVTVEADTEENTGIYADTAPAVPSDASSSSASH